MRKTDPNSRGTVPTQGSKYRSRAVPPMTRASGRVRRGGGRALRPPPLRGITQEERPRRGDHQEPEAEKREGVPPPVPVQQKAGQRGEQRASRPAPPHHEGRDEDAAPPS